MSAVQESAKNTAATSAAAAAAAAAAPAAAAAAGEAVAKVVRQKTLLDIYLEQVQTLAMSLLIVAVLIWLLMTFALMLQQLLVALFLGYLILPVRNWLNRYRLSSVMTYSIILLGVLVIGWIMASMVQQSVSDFSRKWPMYEQNIDKVLKRVTDWVPGVDEGKIRQVVLGGVANEQESINQIRSALLSALDFGGQLLIVLVYVAFLLAEGRIMNRRLRHSFEEPYATDVLVILHRINVSISRYISVKTLVSLLVGGSTTLVLWICGVDYVILWGILAFLLNYVPYIGAAIAVLIPALLAMLQYESPALGLGILVVLNVVHSVIGYWLEPVLMGHRLDLSPLVVILSLAFWFTVWGVVGMIMAVPLMVAIKIVLENIPATRPLAALLDNLPADKRAYDHQSSAAAGNG